jgi:hypothetical protein
VTKKEQTRFITNICNNVRDDLTRMVKDDKIPDSWDGHELREFIKDRSALVSFGTLQGKRKRDYKNHCIINNLP